MHEYSLVAAMMDRVAEAVRQQGATTVRRVTVRLGVAAGVEKDLFRTAFEILTAEAGPCREAELVLDDEPESWECPTPAHGARSTGGRCPNCGSPTRLVGGDGLWLERIEMEVRDV